jgi:tRNA (cmo5U34)-methyltransferase
MEYAAFGSALRKRREAFLFELGNPQTVLVLGDGDGRFLRAFTAVYPEARVDAVDVSAGMIELAKARVASNRVKIHCEDARELPAGDYDLAVAHFFFDCFDEVELKPLLSRIRAKNWLVSEFRNTSWSWPVVRGLYLFFRMTTGLCLNSLPEHRRMLEVFGYRMEKQQQGLGGLLVSEKWGL